MKLNKLVCSTSALAACFFAAAAAAYGGSIDLPVSIKYTGPDRCVPSVAEPITFDITYSDVLTASSASVSNPIVSQQRLVINLDNCPAETIISVEGARAPNEISSVDGVYLQNTLAASWDFDGSAQDVLGLVLKLESFSGGKPGGNYVNPLGFPSDTSILENNVLSVYPEVYVMDKDNISKMSSGTFNATARLNIYPR
ncbi:Uncharacterised protein [Aeromonas salmonicida]|uniref:hypothetical protein n=1 Tax=Aeromonas salmonicida TaxID=645 RepID=UPI001025EF12|nr:hypothetical protein [Aeromonas salmonicida]VFB09615.1 Uncharacterised protein [Aeromonas salmonicida]